MDGQSLTIECLDRIINNNLKIELTKEAWGKVEKSRDVIHKMIADPLSIVYGVTTGFGSFANISIDSNSRKQLQINLIRSHAVGVG